MSSTVSIDPNEPPLFDIDAIPEPDLRDEGLRRRHRHGRGRDDPYDVLGFGNGQLPDAMLQRIGIASHRLHATAAEAFAAAARAAPRTPAST